MKKLVLAMAVALAALGARADTITSDNWGSMAGWDGTQWAGLGDEGRVSAFAFDDAGTLFTTGKASVNLAKCKIGMNITANIAVGASVRAIADDKVAVTVTPPSTAVAWGCEEHLPSGLTPSNIAGSNGTWDASNRKISWWGTDTTVNELSYTVSGAVGTYTLGGTSNFDGVVSVTTTGDTLVGIGVFTITATAGAGGTITPSGDVRVDSGASQSFAIAADTGYDIADVLVDGKSVGAAPSYEFAKVDASHTIAASFSVVTFSITATAGAGGTITPSGDVRVDSGASQSFAIAANAGYKVKDVLVDGKSVGAAPSYEFAKVDADHTIAASFSVVTFSITATAGEGGTITPSGDVEVDSGADIEFVITPTTGHRIKDVLVDTVSIGAVSSHQFTDVTAAHAITAFFALVADQGHHVAYGSVFTVQASDLGKTSFEKPPKVMSSGGGKAKNLNFQKGAASVNCAWTGKDKPNTYALLVDGVLLTEEFVVENPAAFPVSLSADSGVAGDMIVVTGKYFGSKCPKVTMEFIDAKGKAKKANCKVSKPYAYADANGKPGKSVMEVRTGESALSFTVPKGITGATPATLKLNCNGNMIQEPFNATK